MPPSGGLPKASRYAGGRLLDSFKEGNWQIVDAIKAIWQGERDADVLTANIDYNSRAIVLEMLAQLKGETTLTAPEPSSQQTEETESEEEGMPLEKFLELVGLACRLEAPAGLVEQLHGAIRHMAQDPDAPADMRALGQILNQILSGERRPDLSALPPQLADAVRALLADL